MFDTLRQYEQVIGARPVDDWHPPLFVRLWQLVHPLAGGTQPMFAIQVALYAAGFALTVAALARADRWRSAIAAAVVAVSPLLLGWQMVVLKDQQMVGALLLAVGIVAYYRVGERKMPAWAAAAAGFLILYATMLRANAVFMTVPLAVLLLPTRNRLWPSLLFAVVGGVGMLAAMPLVSHHLLGAEASSIAKTQPLFDLAGIAVRTPASPSVFTPGERARMAERHCVKSFFWDPLSDPAGCADATARLLQRSARQLDLELARAAAAHPLAYASHRLAHWNSTERWLVAPGLLEAGPPDEVEPNDLGLGGPGNAAAAAAWQGAAAAEAGTPFGWPIVWTTTALLLLPFAWIRRHDSAASVALALLASAIGLEGSFLVVSISSDLRYHLWPMTASALALILLADALMLRSRWTIAGAAVLASVIGAGMFARATQPPGPSEYQEMITAPTG